MTEQKMSAEQEETMIEAQKSIFQNDYIKNIALSKVGGQNDRYGSFGKEIFENSYLQTASKAPNQVAYEALFGEAVLGEGSVTKEQLKTNAMNFWSSSIPYQNVNDLANKMEYSGQIDSKYSGKALGELEEKDQKMILSSYLQYEVTGLMKTGLESEQKNISGGLEKFLAPTKKDSKESK